MLKRQLIHFHTVTAVENQNLNLKTKRDKAAGINSILAEMLKAKISTTTAVFSNLFSSMWSDRR